MDESAASGRRWLSVSWDLLSTCRPEIEDRARQRLTSAQRRQTQGIVLRGPQKVTSCTKTGRLVTMRTDVEEVTTL